MANAMLNQILMSTIYDLFVSLAKIYVQHKYVHITNEQI